MFGVYQNRGSWWIMRRLLIVTLMAGCYQAPIPEEPEIETYPPYWPVITVEFKDMHDWFWWQREPP